MTLPSLTARGIYGKILNSLIFHKETTGTVKLFKINTTEIFYQKCLC